MKRTIIALLLLLPFTALAGNVPAGKAQALAEKFFGVTATKSVSPVKLVKVGGAAGTKAQASDPTYFVFTREHGGFVVITGDDALPPVLAYSYTSNVPEGAMPDHVRSWYDQLSEAVEYARSHNLKPTAETMSLWDGYVAGNVSAVKQPKKSYQTAEWGQGFPYNDKCPLDEGYRSVTGCVATAMAELLRYFRYPEKGTGTVPGYDAGKMSVPDNPLGHKYLWDKMPRFSYRSFWSEETCEQVSTLMYDCGTMVKMAYSSSGSSAFTAAIPGVFAKYFGYNSDSQVLHGDSFSTSAWVAMLRAELDNNPLIYSAVDKEAGGHCFLLDGYDEDSYFRINFGWEGSYNGYYKFPDFDGSGYHFIYEHQALFNLKPLKTGSVAETVSLSLNADGIGLAANPVPADKNTTFTITTGAIYAEFVSARSTASLIAAHVDAMGNVVSQLSDPISLNLEPGYYFPSISIPNVKLKQDPKPGDRIILMYSYMYSGGWQPCLYPEDQKDLFEIRLSSVPSIAESTHFIYHKKEGSFLLYTLPGASCSVKKDDVEVTTGLTYDKTGGVLTVNESALDGGSYVFTLAYEGQTCSFEVIFNGSKQ